MLPGQQVRRADGTIWQVTEVATTVRTRHPGMRGEHVGRITLTRGYGASVEHADVLSYGTEQAHRLALPPAETLTIVRDQP